MFHIFNMHQKNINAIDLNLMKVFLALAKERSVTKAWGFRRVEPTCRQPRLASLARSLG
jgi:hypothetical protein